MPSPRQSPLQVLMHLSSFWTKKQFNVDISRDCTGELIERQINKTSTAVNTHNPQGYKPLLYKTVDSDFLLTTWTSELWLFLRSSHRKSGWKCHTHKPTAAFLQSLAEKHGLLTFVYFFFRFASSFIFSRVFIQTLQMSSAELIYVKRLFWMAEGKSKCMNE